MKKSFLIIAMAAIAACATPLHAAATTPASSTDYSRLPEFNDVDYVVSLIRDLQYSFDPLCLDVMEKAMARHPRSGEMHLLYIDVVPMCDDSTLRHIDLALRYLPKSDKSKRANAYSWRTSLLLEMGDTTAAMSDLRQAIKCTPANDYLHSAMSDLLLAIGDTVGGKAELKKAIRLSPHDLYHQEKMWDLLFAEGAKNTAEMERMNASICLRHSDDEDYEGDEGYLVLARRCLKSGDEEGFLRNVRKSFELNEWGYWPVGIDEMITECSQATRDSIAESVLYYVNEKNWRLGTSLEEGLMRCGHIRDVLQLSRNRLDHEIGLLDVESLGFLYLTQGDVASAEALCDDALKVAPKSDNLIDLKLACMKQEGRFAEALAYYDSHVQDIDSSASCLLKRARLRVLVGDIDGVIADCQRSIAINKYKADYHALLGWAYLAKGDTVNMRTEMQTAITCLVNSAIFDTSSAGIYAAYLGDAALMKRHLNSSNFTYNRLCAYSVIGNTDAAMALLTQMFPYPNARLYHSLFRNPDLANLRRTEAFRQWSEDMEAKIAEQMK